MSFNSGNMNVTITMIDSPGISFNARPNMGNMSFDLSDISQHINSLMQSLLQNGGDDNPASA